MESCLQHVNTRIVPSLPWSYGIVSEWPYVIVSLELWNFSCRYNEVQCGHFESRDRGAVLCSYVEETILYCESVWEYDSMEVWVNVFVLYVYRRWIECW